jgi:hypothetical protein
VDLLVPSFNFELAGTFDEISREEEDVELSSPSAELLFRNPKQCLKLKLSTDGFRPNFLQLFKVEKFATGAPKWSRNG